MQGRCEESETEIKRIGEDEKDLKVNDRSRSPAKGIYDMYNCIPNAENENRRE